MTTVFDQTTLLTGTDDGDTDGGISLRVVLKPALLSAASGTQCQITVRFGNADISTSIYSDLMYFGQGAAAGSDINFTGDQVQVKWGGSATLNAIASGGAATSDVFTLAQSFDNTKNYVFAFDGHAGTTGSVAFASLTGTDFQFINTAAGTDASQTTPSGSWTAPGALLVFIQKIVITAAGGATPVYDSRKRNWLRRHHVGWTRDVLLKPRIPVLKWKVPIIARKAA